MQKENNRGRFLRWIIFIGLIALFIAGGFYFQHQGNKDLKSIRAGKPEKNAYTSRLVIWGWDESQKKSLEIFQKNNPDVQIDYKTIDSKEYLKKLKVTLAVGGEIPDVVFMENDTRWDFIRMDMWEKLDQPPYNFDPSEVLDYIYPNIIDEQERVVAIPYDVSIAGLAYRKADARAYLGTDDPEKLREKLGTWEDFLKAGVQLKASSNNRKFMLSSLRDFCVMINNQTNEPYIKNGRLNSEKRFEKTIGYLIKMRDLGIVEGTQQWGPSWYASLSTESAVFYPCPGWFIRYVIEPNDATGKNKWGLMVPPEGGFVWGGTAMGIPQSSRNKGVAWRYMKWLLLSEDGARLNRSNLNGMFTHYKKSYEDPTFTSLKEPYFGNQDIGELYIKSIFPTAKSRPIGPDDATIISGMDAVSVAIMKDRNLSEKDAIKMFKELLKKRLPDLIIK